MYGLLFMVVLPVAVGSWWYRSIKYSAEQILMDTMQLYRFFIHKTPNMVLKREFLLFCFNRVPTTKGKQRKRWRVIPDSVNFLKNFENIGNLKLYREEVKIKNINLERLCVIGDFMFEVTNVVTLW